jgi:hypothetical protein
MVSQPAQVEKAIIIPFPFLIHAAIQMLGKQSRLWWLLPSPAPTYGPDMGDCLELILVISYTVFL